VNSTSTSAGPGRPTRRNSARSWRQVRPSERGMARGVEVYSAVVGLLVVLGALFSQARGR
jgi:hypothetical protein